MVLISRYFLPTDFQAFDPSKMKSTRCIGRNIFTNAFVMKSLVREREFFMLNLKTDGLTPEEINLFESLAESANFPESKEYQRQHLHCCTTPNDFEILGCAFSFEDDRYHGHTLYRHKESGLLLPLRIEDSSSNKDVGMEPTTNIENPKETQDEITTEVTTDQGGVVEFVSHKMEDCPFRQLHKDDCDDDAKSKQDTCASTQRRISHSDAPALKNNICAR